MSAKVMCDFRLFGIPFQGLLYSEQLAPDHFYWINSNGDLTIIDSCDGDPMTEDTSRYEHQEIFKLAGTGFYGPVEKTDISASIYLYNRKNYDKIIDPCINADIENGKLVGFAIMDHQ